MCVCVCVCTCGIHMRIYKWISKRVHVWLLRRVQRVVINWRLGVLVTN